VEWNHLAEGRVQWWGVVNVVMNMSSKKGSEFLKQTSDDQLPKKEPLLHEVSNMSTYSFR